MGLKSRAYGVFHPGWFLTGVGVGLVLQFVGWAADFGLAAGLTGYLIMGFIVGFASDGNTIVEPGVAAFCIATIGFVVDHVFLTLLAGIGLVAGIGYGIVGFLVGMAGAWVGEQL